MIDQYFDKIYCINLDSRPDRWELAKKEFEEIGIKNYVRFSGVHNQDNGALGCRDSHLSIIRDAQSNNYQQILIFEDDFVFVNRDQALIKSILEQQKKIEYDLFYFGATVDPGRAHFIKTDSNIVKTNFAFATQAYAVDAKVYTKILEEAQSHSIIDVYYNEYIVSLGNSYISNPMLCAQRPSFSDVELAVVDYIQMQFNFFNQVLNNSTSIL